MVCSGINPPAYGEVENYLRRQRQTDLESFLDSVLGIASVAPQYVGPSLRPGEDIWGVVRRAVSFGPGSYDEIAHYPLARATDIDALQKHAWPTTAFFDYSVLPAHRCDAEEARTLSDDFKCEPFRDSLVHARFRADADGFHAQPGTGPWDHGARHGLSRRAFQEDA